MLELLTYPGGSTQDRAVDVRSTEEDDYSDGRRLVELPSWKEFLEVVYLGR